MPTTYTNGLKLPDLGSIDWFNAYKNNIDILDPIVGTVNGVATTYAPISHNHNASEITSGTIDIARLPPAALERMHIVADQTARYALTTSTVQEGDTVKQTDTGVMYLVVDSTKLNSADGYTEYSAGTASKAIADEDGTSIKTGYGKLAGNQTWSGENAFSNAIRQNNIRYYRNVPSLTKGTLPSSTGYYGVINDYDSTDTRFMQSRGYISTSGSNVYEWNLSSWSSDVEMSVQMHISADGTTKEFKSGANILPSLNSTYSLGSSSYQWSSVYAQTYYYNGTAWGLDKANTWTNVNTFMSGAYGSLITLVNSELDLSNGNTGISMNQHMILVTDSSKTKSYAKWQSWTNDSESITLLTASYYPSSSTSLDFSVLVKASPTETALIPYGVSSPQLGTSTNQWKSVYSQTYYYNGTEFQNKFVTLETVQTISERKNLKKYWHLMAANLKAGAGETYGRTGYSFIYTDKNDAEMGDVTLYKNSQAARTFIRIRGGDYYTNGIPDAEGTLIQSALLIGTKVDSTRVISCVTDAMYPENNNATDLGTSTNKWKTLNGINPGALSLPSESYTNIDTTGWSTTGSGNTYTPTLDGWVYVRITSGSGNYISIKRGGAGSGHLCDTREGTALAYIALTVPVRSGQSIVITLNGTIEQCRFIPCLGNV